MSNNINILYWLNKGRTNKNGYIPIMVRGTYKNGRKQISTGHFIDANKWDAKKGVVKGKDTVAIGINNYIGLNNTKIHDVFNKMIEDGDVYLVNLMDKLLGW